MTKGLVSLLVFLAGPYCIQAGTITLDETVNGSRFDYPAGVLGLLGGNIWMCEPGSPLTATGCVISDLVHITNINGANGAGFAQLISDKDGPNPFDDPADQLGFGTNVPAAGDVFLVEGPTGSAKWAPTAAQIGGGTDPVNGLVFDYVFKSNCSDCELVTEPESAMLPGIAGMVLVLAARCARLGRRS
jgi:hypothetical protein